MKKKTSANGACKSGVFEMISEIFQRTLKLSKKLFHNLTTTINLSFKLSKQFEMDYLLQTEFILHYILLLSWICLINFLIFAFVKSKK